MSRLPPQASLLLLAGGAGTRLWPLSTEARPKQFLEIFDGESLIQRAWRRLRRVVDAERIFVATHENYRQLLLEQLEIPPQNILLEPVRRNTAPAIATCCAEIAKRVEGSSIGIFPSDHFIGREDAFLDAVAAAFAFAGRSDFLVTIGISPTEPATGFGYLEVGQTLEPPVHEVVRFVEKPDRKRAEEFVDSGRFLWNGGMFIWRSDLFEEVLSRTAPEIAELSKKIAGTIDPAERTRLYEQMPSVSIDYAVMERAGRVATVPAELDWSDVGSWSAVARLTSGSARELHLAESRNVFVESSIDRPIAVVGLEGIAVIDSPDGLLVVDLERSEQVGDLVRKMKKGSEK